MGELTHPGHPTFVVLVDQGGAPGSGHEQGAEAEQAPGRRHDGDDGPADVAGDQPGDGPPTWGRSLGDGTHVLVGDVDHCPFQRLVRPSVHLPDDDLRAAHLELEALSSHRLDQHRQLQLATPRHLEDLR